MASVLVTGSGQIENGGRALKVRSENLARERNIKKEKVFGRGENMRK